jgi:hypothetical protein
MPGFYDFAQEQDVQRAIAVIQKMTGFSILFINEGLIRAEVQRGKTPNEIAQGWADRVWPTRES